MINRVVIWSKEFGVATSNGRQIRQGVMGVFAGGAFNPNEHVKLQDGVTMSLPAYAQRTNIQLLKAPDFNSRFKEKECPPTVTVQKVCRVARNEKEVRQMLDLIWKDPKGANLALAASEARNKDLYEFEKSLGAKSLVPIVELDISSTEESSHHARG